MEKQAYILMTDIYRSSYLWEKFPQEYPPVLQEHNRLIEEAVPQQGGSILKGLGDGYIALFDTPADCLRCAVKVQAALSGSHSFGDGTELLVRAVCHGGLLHKLAADDWYGNALNRASRICQVCQPGQLLVTQQITSAADKSNLLDLGEHRLRDLSEPEHLWQVMNERFAKQEFPPLVTLGSRPNNLQVQPTTFVGREAELDELARLLCADDGPRLVTIVAPGGYGKSRLANQLCANLLHRFGSGVFEVQLAALDTGERLGELIATATGAMLAGGRDPLEQAIEHLASKELLLHLDNFEHLTEHAEVVSRLLAGAPQLRIIVTSRQPLRLAGEQVFKLDGLAQNDELGPSVELFADRAAKVRRDFALSEEALPLIASICQSLDGVPLAIEMAAAWVDVFTLSELAEQVGAQLELTSRLRDVPERHRSVRASLDWSWQLLSKNQREILRTLSVFRSGFMQDAAAHLLSGTPFASGFALRAALAGLCDKSWLYTRDTPDGVRFFLRDAAAREYAAERLAETDHREQAISAHAVHYSQLVEREGSRMYRSTQTAAMRVLQAEQHNIFLAAETAARMREPLLLRPLAERLYAYLDALALNHERVRLYSAFVDSARTLEDRSVMAWALMGLGVGYWRLGELDTARPLVEEALVIARATGDTRCEAYALINIGIIHYIRAEYKAALELNTAALALLEDDADVAVLGRCLYNQAQVLQVLGRHAEVEEVLTRCEELCRAHDLTFTLAGVYQSRAVALIEAHDGTGAMPLLEQARALYEQLGNRERVAEMLVLELSAAYELDDYLQMLEMANEALEYLNALGLKQPTARALEYRGIAQHGLGKHLLAVADLGQAGEYFELSGALRNYYQSLRILSLATLALGDTQAAAVLAARAVEHLTDTETDLERLETVFVAGLVGIASIEGARASLLLPRLQSLLETRGYHWKNYEVTDFNEAIRRTLVPQS